MFFALQFVVFISALLSVRMFVCAVCAGFRRDFNDETSSVRSEGSSVRGSLRGRVKSRGRGRGRGRGNHVANAAKTIYGVLTILQHKCMGVL